MREEKNEKEQNKKEQNEKEQNRLGQLVGKQSLGFSEVYVVGRASIVGQKEGKGPLGPLFDLIGDDEFFGCETFEQAESTIQKETLLMAIGNAGLQKEDIRFLFAGDLLGQTIASSFGSGTLGIPQIGLYGACSTCGESLLLGATMVDSGYAKHVACATSSHFASAEKEFRFPMEYGGQRPPYSTRTVTGSGAFVLSCDKKEKNNLARITGATIGKIVDLNVRDAFHMGAAMAPACADLIATHLKDFQRTPEDYDYIFTGDLGLYGKKILLQLLQERGIDISRVHKDCGMEIFHENQKGTNAGGSGCGCSATVLAAYILKKLELREWKRVLFVPTGALLNKTSFNEKQSIPGIAHGVVLESS